MGLGNQFFIKKYPKDFDRIIIMNGKNDKNQHKTISVITWLFCPYNISDIIIIISKS